MAHRSSRGGLAFEFDYLAIDLLFQFFTQAGKGGYAMRNLQRDRTIAADPGVDLFGDLAKVRIGRLEHALSLGCHLVGFTAGRQFQFCRADAVQFAHPPR